MQTEAEQINKAEVEHCQSQSRWSGEQAGAKQCTKVEGQARVQPEHCQAQSRLRIPTSSHEGRGREGGGDSRLSPTPQNSTSPCVKTKTDLINCKEIPEAKNDLMNSIEAYLKEDYRQENMVKIPQRINLQQSEELLFIRSDDYGILKCQESEQEN